MKLIPLLITFLFLAPQTPNDPAVGLTEACIAASGLPAWDANADNGLGAWQFSDDCRALYGVSRTAPSAAATPRGEAWLAMYRHTQYIVSGALPSACAEAPEGWVSSPESLPNGARTIDCGNTTLTFYAH